MSLLVWTLLGSICFSFELFEILFVVGIYLISDRGFAPIEDTTRIFDANR